MTRPHVTLAILTRNRPDQLATALQAALATAEPPEDILVSDDSDDSLAEVTRSIVEGFPGVRYTAGPRRGLGANENHIVRNLLEQAEWVVFNGDDTRLDESFVRNLRTALIRHAPQRRLPTGTETRNGELIHPNSLSFLGFQKIPYPDYSPGARVSTVVVQATAFPAADLRQVSWLEVSTYGFDEVDMAYKMQKLGWSFAFEPSITLIHDQSDVGRDDYPRPTQIARFYFRLRSFSVYDRQPFALLGYLLVAPLQLTAAHVRRRNWREALYVPSVVAIAVRAWLRSLRRDWRHG
jgi:GT2 family glycosyltransferase